jgi:hypothetical protein
MLRLSMEMALEAAKMGFGEDVVYPLKVCSDL